MHERRRRRRRRRHWWWRAAVEVFLSSEIEAIISEEEEEDGEFHTNWKLERKKVSSLSPPPLRGGVHTFLWQLVVR